MVLKHKVIWAVKLQNYYIIIYPTKVKKKKYYTIKRKKLTNLVESSKNYPAKYEWMMRLLNFERKFSDNHEFIKKRYYLRIKIAVNYFSGNNIFYYFNIFMCCG